MPVESVELPWSGPSASVIQRLIHVIVEANALSQVGVQFVN